MTGIDLSEDRGGEGTATDHRHVEERGRLTTTTRLGRTLTVDALAAYSYATAAQRHGLRCDGTPVETEVELITD